MTRIELTWPPSVNVYWRKSPRGMYLTERAKKFRVDVLAIVLETGLGGTFAEQDRLKVAITLYPRTMHELDVDNYSKATLDALEYAKVFPCDSQIDDLRIVRANKIKGGAAIVEISRIKKGKKI